MPNLNALLPFLAQRSEIYLVDNQFAAADKYVRVFDLDGTLIRSVALGQGSWEGLEVSEDRIYGLDGLNPDTVRVWDISGSRLSSEDFVVGNGFWQGLSLYNGLMYIISNNPGRVRVRNLRGELQSFAINLPAGSFRAIAVDDSRIYVLQRNSIWPYDHSGVAQTTERFTPTDAINPAGLDVKDGKLYMTDLGGTSIRVYSTGGVQLSDDYITIPSGQWRGISVQ